MLSVFEYLRALSAVLIVYYHVLAYAPDAMPFLGRLAENITILDYPTREALLLSSYINIGEIAVAMFFLISGFLITRSREGKSSFDFIFKRLIRIYPIAIVGTVLSYFLLSVINWYCFSASVSISDILMVITNALLINDIFPLSSQSQVFQFAIISPHFWFLMVIVHYYLLVVFFRCSTQNNIIFFSLVLLLGSFTYVIFNGSRLSHYLAVLAYSSHHILFILIGSSLYLLCKDYVFNDKAFHLSTQVLTPLFLVLVFVFSFYALTKIESFPLPRDMLKNYFLALMIFVLALFNIKKVTYTPKVVSFYAKTSFSLYVLHYSFGAVFVFLLVKCDFFRNLPILMYFTVFVLLSIASYILYRFVEKPAARITLGKRK